MLGKITKTGWIGQGSNTLLVLAVLTWQFSEGYLVLNQPLVINEAERGHDSGEDDTGVEVVSEVALPRRQVMNSRHVPRAEVVKHVESRQGHSPKPTTLNFGRTVPAIVPLRC